MQKDTLGGKKQILTDSDFAVPSPFDLGSPIKSLEHDDRLSVKGQTFQSEEQNDEKV